MPSLLHLALMMLVVALISATAAAGMRDAEPSSGHRRARIVDRTAHVAHERDLTNAAALVRLMEPDWSSDDHLGCDGEHSLILIPEGDAAGRPTFQMSRDTGLYRVDA